jgi:hypothetical protein
MIGKQQTRMRIKLLEVHTKSTLAYREISLIRFGNKNFHNLIKQDSGDQCTVHPLYKCSTAEGDPMTSTS